VIQLRLQNASLNAFTSADERAFLVNLAHTLGVQSQQVRMDCTRSGHVCWTLPWLPSLTIIQPGQDSLQEKDNRSLLLEKLRRYFMCQFLPVFNTQQFRDKERISDRLPFLESIEPSPELLLNDASQHLILVLATSIHLFRLGRQSGFVFVLQLTVAKRESGSVLLTLLLTPLAGLALPPSTAATLRTALSTGSPDPRYGQYDVTLVQEAGQPGTAHLAASSAAWSFSPLHITPATVAKDVTGVKCS
jgi:hypothetical protein